MPPANLQKSRRRCINFGLGRTPAMSQISPSPLPLSPDDFSLVSPSLAAHAGHDSDTSSLFDVEMVFPQPPPILTSLRRVHSSPLLTAKDTCLAKSVMDKHWDRKLHHYALNKHRSVLAPAQTGHWASTDRPDGLLEELQLELEGEALLSSNASVINAVQSRPLAAHTLESYKYGRMNHALSASESQKSISFPCSSQINKRRNAVLCDSKYTLTAINSGASAMTDKGKKLSHARSASSLLPTLPRIIQKEKMMTSTTLGPTRKVLPKAKSVVPAAVSDSCDYPESNLKKPKVLYRQRLEPLGAQSNQVDTKRVSHRPSLASLACSEQQKPTKRALLPDPFASLSFPNAGLVPPRSLGSPFHHNPTQSQPVAHTTMMSDPSPHRDVPKSFIDITPEQDMRDFTRRELMRKLLVRVSRGVLSWGQTLTQRTKHKSTCEAS
jgi:hypothetical protein